MNIYTEGYLHHKNAHGVNLLKKEGINFFNDTSDGTPDCVHIFDKIIDVRVIKNLENYDGPVVFGPHKFLFNSTGVHLTLEPYNYVDSRLFSGYGWMHQDPYYFNALSPWNKKLQMDIVGLPDTNVITLPFPVDTERFQPEKKTGKPIIYFKNRDPRILLNLIEILGDDFIVFNYSARYREESFLEAVSVAPYCIWIGCHESQGFAFQETLSSNTPIFVIDVKSMRDEFKSDWSNENCIYGHDLAATSAAYFDSSCGVISYKERWQDDFNIFLDNLKSYNPRDFVLTHLSAKPCKKLWEKYA
tara:strand:+ start:562 stop:1467 length:906 start_codon:yes stop_codon:yes gene_type:complete